MKQYKKKVKKKKKNEIEEIVPTKHEKVGNLNLYSEEVSKEIIEKLISLAISSNFNNKIDKKFNDFCFDEFYKKMNNLIQIYYINYENDDFECSDYILSKIKYNYTDTNDNRYKIKKHQKTLNQRNNSANLVLFDIAKINKDEEIEMVIKNKKIEDYLNKSNYININIDLIKSNNIKFDINIKDNNFWGEIAQPKSINIDRSSTKFNSLKLQKDNSNKIIENVSYNKNEDIKKKKLYVLNDKSKEFKNNNNNINNNNELSNKQKRFHPILEMPFIELPEDEIYKNKDNEEIQQLRKEAIKLNLEKEQELKKIKKKKIKYPLIKNIRGKFCTDCEGKLVMIKEIHPESLLKEFKPIMFKQKEILPGKSLQTFQKENYLMEQKAKKNIIYNTGINFMNYNLGINNNKDIDLSIMNRNTKNINSMKEDLFNTQSPSLLSPKNGNVAPSGSNFKIINPSVGVNIKEKNQIKSGGSNFFEQFHKYSINEFNKTLQETLEWETKTKLKGNLITNLNNKIKNIIKEEIDKEIDKNRIKDKIFRKTFSGGFRIRKNMQKSNSDVFSINKKYPVLKEILLHDVESNIDSNKQNTKMEKSLSNENLFDRNVKSSLERRLMNDNKKINYDLVNEFNKELIMGNFAFNNYKNAKKKNLPKLPPKRNNIILPNLLKNINSFNKTANNFYRTRQKKNNDIFSSLSSPVSASNKNKRINSSSKDNN